jgi:hypothetical protein
MGSGNVTDDISMDGTELSYTVSEAGVHEFSIYAGGVSENSVAALSVKVSFICVESSVTLSVEESVFMTDGNNGAEEFPRIVAEDEADSSIVDLTDSFTSMKLLISNTGSVLCPLTSFTFVQTNGSDFADGDGTRLSKGDNGEVKFDTFISVADIADMDDDKSYLLFPFAMKWVAEGGADILFQYEVKI